MTYANNLHVVVCKALFLQVLCFSKSTVLISINIFYLLLLVKQKSKGLKWGITTELMRPLEVVVDLKLV